MSPVPMTDVERVMKDLGLDEAQAKEHIAARERLRNRDRKVQSVRRKLSRLKLKDLK